MFNGRDVHITSHNECDLFAVRAKCYLRRAVGEPFDLRRRFAVGQSNLNIYLLRLL